MARKSRIHFIGAHYHVLLRGNGGNDIFFEPADRETFLALLKENIQRFNFRIHAFCLMTNHVHLALEVGEVPLSKIIQNISFRYTRLINKKKQRIGHLFQGRFKAILIDADSYLLQLIQYIHLNPVRANLVKNPENYLWSSHQAYLNLSSIEWLTTRFILNIFSQDDAIARKKYKLFITKNYASRMFNFEKSNQKSFPAICDDIFMKKIASLQNTQTIKPYLKDIIKLVCKFYLINEEKLHVKTRDRKNAKIRAIIALVAVEFKVSTASEVALYFGRDHSTMSRIMRRIQNNVANIELMKIKELIQATHTQT